MIGYDLSNSKLASADGIVQVPVEGELLAVLVALMLLEDIAFSELPLRELQLTPRNRNQVAAMIRHRLTPLARDFMGRPDLCDRLDELVGLKIIFDGVC